MTYAFMTVSRTCLSRANEWFLLSLSSSLIAFGSLRSTQERTAWLKSLAALWFTTLLDVRADFFFLLCCFSTTAGVSDNFVSEAPDSERFTFTKLFAVIFTSCAGNARIASVVEITAFSTSTSTAPAGVSFFALLRFFFLLPGGFEAGPECLERFLCVLLSIFGPDDFASFSFLTSTDVEDIRTSSVALLQSYSWIKSSSSSKAAAANFSAMCSPSLSSSAEFGSSIRATG
mmetsp:Transcript_31255/g.47851  ORF Transcript_31255/g.47851 Transcript_31255/m.47851 type:complete len:231 (-) Transcript_31255:418-1110(-)